MNGRKNKTLNKKIDAKIPVVLFHGLKDKLVPLKFSRKILELFKTQNKKIIKIKDGDHSLSRKKDLRKIIDHAKSQKEKRFNLKKSKIISFNKIKLPIK